MGKKKTVSKTNPEAIKEAGNKAFGLGSFEEAIKLYSQAIELQPSHIYYANRANAYLETDQFLNAISDCDDSIKLDPKYPKSYARKGNALLNLIRVKEAIDCFQLATELDPENEEYKKLLEEAKYELSEDTKIPEDNPVKQKFNQMFSELKENGAKFDKLKLRYYTQDFRGIHAAAPIKNGETVVYMPLDNLITSKVAKESKYVQKALDPLKEKFPESGIEQLCLSIYVVTEKKNPDSKFKNFFDTLPQSYDEFPVFFTDE